VIIVPLLVKALVDTSTDITLKEFGMMRTWSSLRSDSKALAHARHSVHSQRVRRTLHRYDRLRSLTSDGISNAELSNGIAPDSNGPATNSPRDEDEYAASMAMQKQLSDIAMLEGDTVMAKELKENGARGITA
jgi:hypothetical protein